MVSGTRRRARTHRRYRAHIARLLVIALCAVAFTGCGGSSRHGAATTAEHPASAAERTTLTQVAADLINAYESADARTLCGLLTPAALDRWRTQLAAGDPSLDGRSCTQLIPSDTFGDPSDQPPAIDEASGFKFRRVAVNGDHATLTFPDGRSWQLVRRDGRWLIDDLPLVPRSLMSSQTT
jgi:hypothetical protein